MCEFSKIIVKYEPLYVFSFVENLSKIETYKNAIFQVF